MKKFLSKLGTALILSGAALSSNAAVITYGDYTWDDSTNYVTNSVTGQEWLRWTETQSQNIAQASSSFGGEGYSVATNSDMQGLFLDFFDGAWDNNENTHQSQSYSSNEGAYDAFQSLFGISNTYCSWSETCTTDEHYRNVSSAVFGSDHDGDGLVNSVAVFDSYLGHPTGNYSLPAEMVAGRATLSDDYITLAGQSSSVVMLRAPVVTSVPEPASLALLGLGLFGLGFARRG